MGTLNIGFSNHVNKDKILAIVNYKGQALLKTANSAKENNKYIDCTHGRKTRALIFLTDGAIVSSTIEAGTLAKRAIED